MNDKPMSAEELLAAVQYLKESCVGALVLGDEIAIKYYNTKAKMFLCEHYAQVLDILDDALTDYLNK